MPYMYIDATWISYRTYLLEPYYMDVIPYACTVDRCYMDVIPYMYCITMLHGSYMHFIPYISCRTMLHVCRLIPYMYCRTMLHGWHTVHVLYNDATWISYCTYHVEPCSMYVISFMPYRTLVQLWMSYCLCTVEWRYMDFIPYIPCKTSTCTERHTLWNHTTWISLPKCTVERC